jgi:hypothetical protein
MNNDNINKLFIKEINNNIIFNEYKKINIFTTKFGYYIAESMKYILEELKFEVNIVYEIDLNNNDLYIILFSQKVQSFPKNYIIYQLEQKDISKWVDKKYKLSILFSKCSFDYSQSNINKFENIIQNKLIYIPIPLIPMKLINPNIINDNMINTNNNILFYGSMNDTYSNTAHKETQHIGLGKKLLAEAEKIAKSNLCHKCDGMMVIAGVGTRNYYRKFGYEIPYDEKNHGDFMIKNF